MLKIKWCRSIRLVFLLVMLGVLTYTKDVDSFKMVVLILGCIVVVVDILSSIFEKRLSTPSGRIVIDTKDVKKDTISIEYFGHPLSMAGEKSVTFEVETLS